MSAHAIKSDFPCHRVDRGWIVWWRDYWFCNRCDKDNGDVESVVFDGRSSEESVGCYFNEFAGCENMVKKGSCALSPKSKPAKLAMGTGGL